MQHSRPLTTNKPLKLIFCVKTNKTLVIQSLRRVIPNKTRVIHDLRRVMLSIYFPLCLLLDYWLILQNVEERFNDYRAATFGGSFAKW